MTTEDTPFPAVGYLQIPVPGVPYSAVRVPIINDLERDNLWVEHAMLIAQLASKAYKEAFPDAPPAPAQTQPPQQQQPRPQVPQQPQQGQQGQSRADKYPVISGWQCDSCGGPVGRRARTGNMRNDAAVCLGRCKDGQFVHTVAWLD
ncbi:MAG: hypothetical protein IT367_20225 [Candidatus Hydrogenedentes bacterium]|nr:hypothetical protein [Candidatus Hydrogenedentota bacterium]